MDRRHDIRAPFDVLVMVFFHGHPIDVYRTRDISSGGLRLLPGKILFFPGVTLELLLPVPGRNGIQLPVMGQVANLSRRGMGLVLHSPPGGLGHHRDLLLPG